MGKMPSLAHHRSISVREKSSHSSPQLRRSASAYTEPAAPVAIGSKGSIFSLVDRDTITTRSSNGSETSKSSHAWHNKLWIITRKTSANQHQNPAKLHTVVESIQETRVPKWKQFFRKLKGGAGGGRGGGGGGCNNNNSSNAKRGDYPNDVGGNGNNNSHSNNNAKIRDYLLNDCGGGNNDAKRRDYPNGDAPNGLHLPSLQPKEQPISPIWERRNVAQISPLNLSHLYTSKIKREHAKKPPV